MQRFKNMRNRGGTTEGPSDMPTFALDAVATCHPYLHTSEPHPRIFAARVEQDIRRGPFLVTSSQFDFGQQAPANNELLYPEKPEWWPQVMIPYGIPALLPRLVDHFGSAMLTASPDHVVCHVSYTVAARGHVDLGGLRAVALDVLACATPPDPMYGGAHPSGSC